MNITLYKLADEYLIAAEKLQEMDMPPEVVEDTLESISGDIQEKATNIAMLVMNWESTVEAMEKAEKEIASRRKAVENRINHIKEYLLFNMQRTGIKKIDCPYFSLSVRNNPPKVEIFGQLPDEFMRHPEPPPPIPDKKAIAEFLKAGNTVDWAKLVQTERLEIK
jgi:hypothetical protein